MSSKLTHHLPLNNHNAKIQSLRIAMSNKRRIYITIHHRGALSLGKDRAKLQHSAFHWGILVAPKSFNGTDCTMYDVTNSLQPIQDHRHDLNVDGNWFFRSRQHVNLFRDNVKVIGRIMIGKVPNNISDDRIEGILKNEVPLPDKEAVPVQNCVSWTWSAVQALQDGGLVAQKFRVEDLAAWALEYADYCIANLNPLNVREFDKRLLK